MASTSVDQLYIEIQAKATSAQSAVRGLASDLETLAKSSSKPASGLSKTASAVNQLASMSGAASQVGQLASALSAFKGLTISSTIGKNLSAAATAAAQIPATSDLSSFASTISSLNGVKISATLGNQLKNISAGLSTLNETSFDASKLHEVATALNEIASVPKSSASSSISALKKIPEAVEAINSVDLSGFKEKCDQISAALGTLPPKMSSVAKGFGAIKNMAGSAKSSLKETGDAAKSSGSDFDSFAKRLSSVAKKIRDLATVVGTIRGVGQILSNLITASNEYIEDMNLADTSLGEYAQDARDYADQVKAALSLDQGAWLRNQGTFMSMAAGMGVATDKAYTMSQGLTQLGYDLASFFNISTDEAFQKLQSGLAGEIEPLRRLGYDLTEARLQQEAYSMGIDESVSNMTQAEKAMLRYNAIMHQITWAQGDMAKTISSPANALRVLSDNVHQAARSIGNVFLPMLQAILPVAIAVAKAVATLANMLADLTGGSQIASIEYGSGGLGGLGSAGETAADGISDAGDAAQGTGNKAGKAAKQVKELKRELMGFDEINKFSTQSDSSGSGGSGGSGGGGGGAGGGGGSSIPIQSYDFLGDGTGLSDDLYNAIMDAVARAAKAFEPLVESVKTVCAAIANQFRGLDIAGAIENSFMGALNLISNFARNVVEILGPMVVAFNFPETIALSFDLAAQMCLTLSAAINAVGSMVKGFTDTALVQLVAWIGDKVRGAIYLCIDELQRWQNWFQKMTPRLNQLGQLAGQAASYVLQLAEAFANVAFQLAAVTFSSVSSALRVLLEALLNSGAATAMARALGAALAAWAVGSAISAGIQAITTTFFNLAVTVEQRANAISSSSQTASSSIGDLRTSFDLAKDAASRLTTAFMENTSAGQAIKAAQQAVSSAVERVKTEFKGAGAMSDYYMGKANALSPAIEKAKQKVDAQRTSLDQAKSALEKSGSAVDFFAMKQKEAKLRSAEASLEIKKQKQAADLAKSGLKSLSATSQESSAAQAQLSAQLNAANAGVTRSTASKALAVVQDGFWTAATGAATVAQNLLNAAVSAFPGMILASALGAVMGALQPLIDGIGGAIAGWLGLDTATSDVTETTEQANQVLSEEQQQINDNVDSIKEYEKTHDNLRDALEASRMSEEQFAQYLQQTGQTFDEVASAQDQFVDKTVNGFDKIDTSSQLSLENVNKNLQSNLVTQQQWSDDIVALCSQTGWDMNSSMVQSLLSAGPEKMGKALHEVITDPTSEESQQFLDLLKQTGEQTSPTLAAAIDGSGDAAYNAMVAQMNGVETAVSDGGEGVSEAASDVDEQTVQQFGSHYGEAFDAGRNLAGGFGDGVRDASNDATVPAKELMSAVVNALNGGLGHTEARSAGRNLAGGFADGIRDATQTVASSANALKSSTVKALNGGKGYSEAKSAGANLAGGYGDGLRSAVNGSVSAANNARTSVVRALNGGVGYSSARSAGANLMGGFADGLNSAVSRAQSVAKNASNLARAALASNVQGARSAGSNMGGGFSDGIGSASGSAYSSGRNLATKAQDGAGSNYWGAYSAGSNFGYGFRNGIDSTASAVYRSAQTIADNAARTLRNALRVHSPSRVTSEVGMYFDLGMAQGISSYASRVNSSVSSMASKALDATSAASEMGKAAGGAFGDALAANVDSGVVTSALGDAMDVSANLTWAGGSNRRSLPTTSHATSAVTQEDASMADVIAGAVARGMVTVQMGAKSAGTSQGDTTIVLRVGNEDLARAVYKGNQSLARRGVVQTY